jgi:hypothetical protein
MPKTAVDPFFATNNEPVAAGRKATVLAAGSYSADLAQTSSSLIISATAAGSLSVIMADDPDTKVTTFPVPVGMSQIQIQVRRVVTVPTSCTVVALWS